MGNKSIKADSSQEQGLGYLLKKLWEKITGKLNEKADKSEILTKTEIEGEFLSKKNSTQQRMENNTIVTNLNADLIDGLHSIEQFKLGNCDPNSVGPAFGRDAYSSKANSFALGFRALDLGSHYVYSDGYNTLIGGYSSVYPVSTVNPYSFTLNGIEENTYSFNSTYGQTNILNINGTDVEFTNNYSNDTKTRSVIVIEGELFYGSIPFARHELHTYLNIFIASKPLPYHCLIKQVTKEVVGETCYSIVLVDVESLFADIDGTSEIVCTLICQKGVEYSTAIGYGSGVGSPFATSIGRQNSIRGFGSVGIGTKVVNDGDAGLGMGNNIYNVSNNFIGIGSNLNNKGYSTTMIGYGLWNNNTAASNAVIIGNYNDPDDMKNASLIFGGGYNDERRFNIFKYTTSGNFFFGRNNENTQVSLLLRTSINNFGFKLDTNGKSSVLYNNNTIAYVPTTPDIIEDGHNLNLVRVQELKDYVNSSIGGVEQNVQADWSELDETAGSYIKNKPIIGNGAVTVKQNGEVKSTFTLDQTSDAVIELTDTTYGNATADVSGLMSSDDKAKLNSIESGANNYTLPVATSSEIGGVKSGTDITIDSEGNVSVNDNSHNHSAENITTGILPIERGGTGKSTAAEALSVLASSSTTPTTSDITADDTKILSSNSSGSWSNVYATTALSVWNYVKGKLKTVIGLDESSYSGTSDRAISDGSGNVIEDTYVTKTELNEKANIDYVDSELSNKVDKVEGKGLSTEDFTSSLKSKLDNIEAGAQVNNIAGIKQNGNLINPDSSKIINITVPTKLSELTNDGSYQTASDVSSTITGLTLDTNTGIITATRKNGTTFTLDLPTEKVIKSGYYDGDSEEIVMVLADESEIRFSASELVDSYLGDGSTIELYSDSDGKKRFRISTTYKNKIDGAEQTSNRTSTVNSSSTASQYPTAIAVWNAIKNFATNTQTFTQASSRSNLTSGETISTSFGKISKWFADLKSVAFSGSYNDLSDKPTIGNATITIKQNGTTIGSFLLNQSDAKTIELTDNNTTYVAATESAAGLLSAADKKKLNGIATGAEVNVQSDWNVSDTSSDAYIKNKPTSASIVTSGGGINAAGTGLSKSGNTLNHSNSITAQTTSKFVAVKVDAQGHISAIGDTLEALTVDEINAILV
jgi:hypothetical protein